MLQFKTIPVYYALLHLSQFENKVILLIGPELRYFQKDAGIVLTFTIAIILTFKILHCIILLSKFCFYLDYFD